jgi:hypothetical protein
MGEQIICHGCGQRIELPEEYRRNKIQCPECGVITPVNLAGNKPKAADSSQPDSPFETAGAASQGNLLPATRVPEPEPEVQRKPKPKPEPAPKPQTAKRRPREAPPKEEPLEETPPSEPAVWTCSHCGEWQPHPPRGKKARCPVCKTPLPAPVKAPPGGITAQVLQARGPRTAVPQADSDWSEDPEDSKPYRVDSAEHPGCPGCGQPMEPEAILCLNCGLDLRDGAKTKTVYDIITRRWDAGLARPFRFLAFGVGQFIALPPLIWGATHEGHEIYALGIWLWFSLMSAFLLGTYDRIDLHRSARGKVRLVKTWYFCFVQRDPVVIDLLQYEGIVIGRTHELEFTEYVVLIAGIFFFIVPGIIWYFAVMNRDTCFVALTKDHGHPDLWLYRGFSEKRSKEISSTLRTAALPEYPWF